MPKSRTRKPRKQHAQPSASTSRAWEDVPLLPGPLPSSPARATTPSTTARAADPLATLEALRGVVRDLDGLARRRSALQRQRAALVDQARAEGASWATLRAITGTTRQALVSAAARVGDLP